MSMMIRALSVNLHAIAETLESIIRCMIKHQESTKIASFIVKNLLVKDYQSGKPVFNFYPQIFM